MIIMLVVELAGIILIERISSYCTECCSRGELGYDGYHGDYQLCTAYQ